MVEGQQPTAGGKDFSTSPNQQSENIPQDAATIAAAQRIDEWFDKNPVKNLRSLSQILWATDRHGNPDITFKNSAMAASIDLGFGEKKRWTDDEARAIAKAIGPRKNPDKTGRPPTEIGTVRPPRKIGRLQTENTEPGRVTMISGVNALIASDIPWTNRDISGRFWPHEGPRRRASLLKETIGNLKRAYKEEGYTVVNAWKYREPVPMKAKIGEESEVIDATKQRILAAGIAATLASPHLLTLELESTPESAEIRQRRTIGEIRAQRRQNVREYIASHNGNFSHVDIANAAGITYNQSVLPAIKDSVARKNPYNAFFKTDGIPSDVFEEATVDLIERRHANLDNAYTYLQENPQDKYSITDVARAAGSIKYDTKLAEKIREIAAEKNITISHITDEGLLRIVGELRYISPRLPERPARIVLRRRGGDRSRGKSRKPTESLVDVAGNVEILDISPEEPLNEGSTSLVEEIEAPIPIPSEEEVFQARQVIALASPHPLYVEIPERKITPAEIVEKIREGRREKIIEYIESNSRQLWISDIEKVAGLSPNGKGIMRTIRGFVEDYGVDTSTTHVPLDPDAFGEIAFKFIESRFVDLDYAAKWLEQNPKPFYSATDVLRAVGRDKVGTATVSEIKKKAIRLGVENTQVMRISTEQVLILCAGLPPHNTSKADIMAQRMAKKREEKKILATLENRVISPTVAAGVISELSEKLGRPITHKEALIVFASTPDVIREVMVKSAFETLARKEANSINKTT